MEEKGKRGHARKFLKEMSFEEQVKYLKSLLKARDNSITGHLAVPAFKHHLISKEHPSAQLKPLLRWYLGQLAKEFIKKRKRCQARIPFPHVEIKTSRHFAGIDTGEGGMPNGFSKISTFIRTVPFGLIPFAMPVAMSLSVGEVTTVVLATVGAVVGGGLVGDHCSPLSDTTCLSSFGAGSDHIDHVSTQLPYALAAGGLAAVLLVIIGTMAV